MVEYLSHYRSLSSDCGLELAEKLGHSQRLPPTPFTISKSVISDPNPNIGASLSALSEHTYIKIDLKYPRLINLETGIHYNTMKKWSQRNQKMQESLS